MHASVTRVTTGAQPLASATIVGQEMHRWLRETEGFERFLLISRDGTTLGITFWESRELAERNRTSRLEFLRRMTSVAGVHVEEVVDYEVTFAQLGPLVEP